MDTDFRTQDACMKYLRELADERRLANAAIDEARRLGNLVAQRDELLSVLSGALGRLRCGDKWVTFAGGAFVVTLGVPYAANTVTIYEGDDLAAALRVLAGEEADNDATY